uniref:PPM-type phosphatase domain-containing protein n=1 Tax=Parastrongyloides trichosuri TaxID=131310 RepID=A0A0N4Z3S8_PARTI
MPQPRQEPLGIVVGRLFQPPFLGSGSPRCDAASPTTDRSPFRAPRPPEARARSGSPDTAESRRTPSSAPRRRSAGGWCRAGSAPDSRVDGREAGRAACAADTPAPTPPAPTGRGTSGRRRSDKARSWAGPHESRARGTGCSRTHRLQGCGRLSKRRGRGAVRHAPAGRADADAGPAAPHGGPDLRFPVSQQHRRGLSRLRLQRRAGRELVWRGRHQRLHRRPGPTAAGVRAGRRLELFGGDRCAGGGDRAGVRHDAGSLLRREDLHAAEDARHRLHGAGPEGRSPDRLLCLGRTCGRAGHAVVGRRRPGLDGARLSPLLPDAGQWRRTGRRAPSGPQDRRPDDDEPSAGPLGPVHPVAVAVQRDAERRRRLRPWLCGDAGRGPDDDPRIGRRILLGRHVLDQLLHRPCREAAPGLHDPAQPVLHEEGQFGALVLDAETQVDIVDVFQRDERRSRRDRVLTAAALAVIGDVDEAGRVVAHRVAIVDVGGHGPVWRLGHGAAQQGQAGDARGDLGELGVLIGAVQADGQTVLTDPEHRIQRGLDALYLDGAAVDVEVGARLSAGVGHGAAVQHAGDRVGGARRIGRHAQEDALGQVGLQADFIAGGVFVLIGRPQGIGRVLIGLAVVDAAGAIAGAGAGVDQGRALGGEAVAGAGRVAEVVLLEVVRGRRARQCGRVQQIVFLADRLVVVRITQLTAERQLADVVFQRAVDGGRGVFRRRDALGAERAREGRRAGQGVRRQLIADRRRRRAAADAGRGGDHARAGDRVADIHVVLKQDLGARQPLQFAVQGFAGDVDVLIEGLVRHIGRGLAQRVEPGLALGLEHRLGGQVYGRREVLTRAIALGHRRRGDLAPTQIVFGDQHGALDVLVQAVGGVLRNVITRAGIAQRQVGQLARRHDPLVGEGRQVHVLGVDQEFHVPRAVVVAELAAHDVAVGVVVINVALGVVIDAVALPGDLGADAHGDLVIDLLVDDALDAQLAQIVGIGGRKTPGVAERRLGQDDVDGAELGVAAVKGALRAFQNLDAGDVEIVQPLEVASAQGAAADIGAVDEQADAGIGAGGALVPEGWRTLSGECRQGTRGGQDGGDVGDDPQAGAEGGRHGLGQRSGRVHLRRGVHRPAGRRDAVRAYGRHPRSQAGPGRSHAHHGRVHRADRPAADLCTGRGLGAADAGGPALRSGTCGGRAAGRGSGQYGLPDHQRFGFRRGLHGLGLAHRLSGERSVDRHRPADPFQGGRAGRAPEGCAQGGGQASLASVPGGSQPLA